MNLCSFQREQSTSIDSFILLAVSSFHNLKTLKCFTNSRLNTFFDIVLVAMITQLCEERLTDWNWFNSWDHLCRIKKSFRFLLLITLCIFILNHVKMSTRFSKKGQTVYSVLLSSFHIDNVLIRVQNNIFLPRGPWVHLIIVIFVVKIVVAATVDQIGLLVG